MPAPVNELMWPSSSRDREEPAENRPLEGLGEETPWKNEERRAREPEDHPRLDSDRRSSVPCIRETHDPQCRLQDHGSMKGSCLSSVDKTTEQTKVC